MSDVLSTAVYQEFGGRECKFEIRLGQMRELERACEVGIGAIYMRLATLQYRFDDVRNTIRFGLIGGGMSEAEAEAMMRFTVDGKPLAPHVALAVSILRAMHEGIAPGKAEEESQGDPATSPPITRPVARSGSPRAKSTR